MATALGERRWLADFAWPRPDLKVAVRGHRGAHDEEARRRDQAYIEDGWTLHTAGEWLEQLDSLLSLLPDVETRGRA